MRGLLLLGWVAIVGSTQAMSATPPLSRVYVTALPCSVDSKAESVQAVGAPSVTLYDQTQLGQAGDKSTLPLVTVTQSAKTRISFYFDAVPGFYEAFVRFQNGSDSLGSNGPLIVIPGRDRHLILATCNHMTDWHGRAVITGLLPQLPVMVSVIAFRQPVKCGDDIYAFNEQTNQLWFPRTTSRAVTDDGAYYANFRAAGKQDRTVALLITGALFDEGAILLTNTPETPRGKVPFIRKDVTPAIIAAAFKAGQKLGCVDGF